MQNLIYQFGGDLGLCISKKNPGDASVTNSRTPLQGQNACQSGDVGSIPGLGRSPAVGNGNQLHYSCLGNSMDRGAWQTTDHGVAESDMSQQFKNNNNFRVKGIELWLSNVAVPQNHLESCLKHTSVGPTTRDFNLISLGWV